MLNYLKSFISLASTLSFSKTAENLRTSQPCISRQIRLLEEKLSYQLFLRSKHKVFLTEKGNEFRDKIAPLFSELSGILNEQVSSKSEISGTISIGSLAEVGQFYVMHKAVEFAKNYPSVTLRMEYLKQAEILDRIKSGAITFGIITELPKGENIRSYKLMRECVVLVKRRELKLPAVPKFVSYRDADPLLNAFMKRFKKKLEFSSFEEKIVVNSHKSMIDCLLTNDYCAVMPYHSVSHLVENDTLSYETGVCLESDIYLAHYHNPRMDNRDKSFRSFLITEAKKQPYVTD